MDLQLTEKQLMAVENILKSQTTVNVESLSDDMKKIANYEGQNSFVNEIKGKLTTYGTLTEKQVSAALNQIQKEENKNKTKNNYIVLKEVYNICISAINIFRPLVAMEIYIKYKPTSILDFTCGWGGRLVGACALNIPNYIGIDINTNLTNSYLEMKTFLKNYSNTNIEIFLKNAVDFD